MLREKTQKLLLQEGVDAVVGFLNRTTVDHIAPLFSGTNRLLLVLDMLGEFFVDKPIYPGVLFHSLQLCLSARLTARKAVEQGARGVIQASSFYEAGYLQGYAAAQGVDASGGSTVHYAVSSHKLKEISYDSLHIGIQSGKAQAVVALYSGDMAEHFLAVYPGLPGKLPLWAGPMLLEESMLKRVHFRGQEAQGYVPWSVRLKLAENEQFVHRLKARGRQPTLLAVLGYEGGLIMAEYARMVQQKGYPILEHTTTLSRFTFTGPRGPVFFDERTHYSFGPQYATSMEADEDGHLRLGECYADESWKQAWKAFEAEPLLGQYSGWTNIYLCI